MLMWASKCGSQQLNLVSRELPDGSIVWNINNASGSTMNSYSSSEEAEIAFFQAVEIFESLHQNSIGCCGDPNYMLGQTIEQAAESEEKLAYATPCGRKTISVVRKSTMTGRSVWDVTTGTDNHPIAMMYDTFDQAKNAYEDAVDMIKDLHQNCCIISDHIDLI